MEKEKVLYYLEEFKKTRPEPMNENIDKKYFGMGRVMGHLYNCKDFKCLAGELAEAVHCSTARVAVLIDKLETKGLVRREQDKLDHRKTFVVLTDEGKIIHKHYEEEFIFNIGKMIDEVGEKDINEFIRISKKIQKSLGKPTPFEELVKKTKGGNN